MLNAITKLLKNQLLVCCYPPYDVFPSDYSTFRNGTGTGIERGTERGIGTERGMGTGIRTERGMGTGTERGLGIERGTTTGTERGIGT